MTVTLRAESGVVAVLADGAVVTWLSQAELSARLMLPTATAPGWRGCDLGGRAGAALAFLAGAGEQWYADAGLPPRQRVARAITRGGTVSIARSARGGSACSSVLPADLRRRCVRPSSGWPARLLEAWPAMRS